MSTSMYDDSSAQAMTDAEIAALADMIAPYLDMATSNDSLRHTQLAVKLHPYLPRGVHAIHGSPYGNHFPYLDDGVLAYDIESGTLYVYTFAKTWHVLVGSLEYDKEAQALNAGIETAHNELALMREQLAMALTELATLRTELTAVRSREVRRIIRKSDNGKDNGNQNRSENHLSSCETTRGRDIDPFDDDLPF